MANLFVTGAAGFIGYHLCQHLLQQGHDITGIDNLNSYYDVELKKSRVTALQQQPESDRFQFVCLDLSDREAVAALFQQLEPQQVIHLAAQAGVRYSLENPHAYVDSNLVGFVNILEGCRHTQVEHLLYASSSSVYGANRVIPFSVEQNVDHPISLYAATKKAGELMAHTYSHLYGLPTTGLRFFTVYGPWGRPDMAYFKFTDCIFNDRPIEVYNHGAMRRDFTYVDDVVEMIERLMPCIPTASDNPENLLNPGISTAPYCVHNLGNHQPVELLRFIEILEEAIGKTAIKTFLPLQPGDVVETYADTDSLYKAIGTRPRISLEEGLPQFVQWYRDYYQV
ncbi:MAG: NAD-dependent epimerase [Prochlorotrichaceae cyanobacterium]|jgi:UDP-glucuronate 4-epimerase